jgi:hypothetical protein
VWADSERALYGRDHALPIGWCDGALTLCAAPPAAAPAPRKPGLRRLVVRTASAALLLALALLWLAGAARADTSPPAAASVAETSRADALARAGARPLDWMARYNLGLAEAASQRPGYAFAETVAAFAQAPRQPVVRAALNDLAAALPTADAGVVSLAQGQAPAAWLAVWQWQLALLAGALLMAAALGLAMLPAAPRAAVVAGGCGVLLAASAGLALWQYGSFGDPRAALVARDTVLRGLPTDAQPADGVPPLAAGSVVRVEKDFLGWTSIRRAGGAGGWVRSGELVPVYAAPNA